MHNYIFLVKFSVICYLVTFRDQFVCN